MTTIRFRTGPYRAPVDSARLDITRVGCDRASDAGHPAPGSPFAPSKGLLWPAKSHLDLVAALERRADALPPGEAASSTALMAAELLGKVEAAYARLYTSEMRVSAGLRSDNPRWGADEDGAVRRGVRQQPATWKTLLDGSLATENPLLVCFCARRQPGPGQRHTCHRHHLAGILAAFGAVDDGEVELPATTTAPRPGKAPPPLLSLLAVSGCRPPPAGSPRGAYDVYQAICADVETTIAALPPDVVVIHGGADGVDSLAGEVARKTGHGEITYRPWYDAWGKGAPLVRNAYVATATRWVGWAAPWSRGTPQAEAIARRAGVEVDSRRFG